MLKGLHVLVTSGPTRTYIDKIRFLTNRSSGKMGHAMAEAAQKLGAEVVLITGPVEDKYATLENAEVFRVESAQEMEKLAKLFVTKADLVIAAAAVSDFEMETQEGKIHRQDKLALDLQPSRDILAELGKRKRIDQVFIGFAAEWGDSEQEIMHAKEKLWRKNLDFLVFNNVARSDIGFDSDDNEVIVFEQFADKTLEHKIKKSRKRKLAEEILNLVENRIKDLKTPNEILIERLNFDRGIAWKY